MRLADGRAFKDAPDNHPALIAPLWPKADMRLLPSVIIEPPSIFFNERMYLTVAWQQIPIDCAGAGLPKPHRK